MTIESLAILGLALFIVGVAGVILFDKMKASALEEKARHEALKKKREELLKSAPPKPIPTPRGSNFSSTTIKTTTTKRGGSKTVSSKKTMSDAEITIKELIDMIEEIKKKV